MTTKGEGNAKMYDTTLKRDVLCGNEKREEHADRLENNRERERVRGRERKRERQRKTEKLEGERELQENNKTDQSCIRLAQRPYSVMLLLLFVCVFHSTLAILSCYILVASQLIFLLIISEVDAVLLITL